MTYHPRKIASSRRAYPALGSVTSVTNAAVAVATDPCLGDVAALTLRLRDLERTSVITGAPKAPAPGTAPKPPAPGIGLCKVVTPLRYAVYLRERPWLIPLGAAAIVGTFVGIGYLLGSGSRKR